MFKNEPSDEARDHLEMLVADSLESDGEVHEEYEYVITPVAILLAVGFARDRWFLRHTISEQKKISQKLADRWRKANRFPTVGEF